MKPLNIDITFDAINEICELSAMNADTATTRRYCFRCSHINAVLQWNARLAHRVRSEHASLLHLLRNMALQAQISMLQRRSPSLMVGW